MTALNDVIFYEKVIIQFKNQGCTVVTLPEIYWEYIRGSDTIQGYQKRKRFVETFITTFPSIDKRLDNKIIVYLLALHKACSKMDYVDLLLGVSLCLYPDTYVLTQNHHHFPLFVFERVGVVTVDNNQEIHNHGLYTINQDKLTPLVQSLTYFSCTPPQNSVR